MFVFLFYYNKFYDIMSIGVFPNFAEKRETEMKKFTVGLPTAHNDAFVGRVIEYKESISEVYFSWGDFPSGRSAQNGYVTPWEAQAKQIETLERLFSEGLSFNLLFNANCYGEDATSRAFYERVGETVDYVATRFRLSSVTTTSPLIAKFIKNNFQSIKTRASVNMEIGTEEGFSYLSDVFDGYYMKREFNRNMRVIKRLREWCDAEGKELFMLANSGCLNNCSAHIFHDNLVAHERGIAAKDNAYGFDGVCRDYLGRDGSIGKYLCVTNFIRPEDVHLVEKYFDGIKLATRINPNPARILDAYVGARYSGAVTSLLEPDHTGVLYPRVIENGRIDPEWTKTVLTCNKDCRACGFCVRTAENAIIKLEDI